MLIKNAFKIHVEVLFRLCSQSTTKWSRQNTKLSCLFPYTVWRKHYDTNFTSTVEFAPKLPSANVSKVLPKFFSLKNEVTEELALDVRGEYLGSHIRGFVEEFGIGLIGLEGVKRRVRGVALNLLIGLVRERMGLLCVGGLLGVGRFHMSFTGSPGTGKTLVAGRLSSLLCQLGVLEKGHLVVAAREDLVGQYIGHTAPKVRAVFRRAEGGVLFLDAAYSLYRPANARDFGVEVVEMLLQYMEGCGVGFVVVFAGYKPPMQLFFKCNPGLASRVSTHIDFPAYTTLELMLLVDLFCSERNYVINRWLLVLLWIYFDFEKDCSSFANARAVELLVGRLILSHARRLFRGLNVEREVTKGLLTTLTGEDLLALLSE